MSDYQYIEPQGVIVADTSTTLSTVQDEFRSALGADLIVDASTPQGVLITAEALARDAVIKNNAALANQINPNIAGGVFLDAIMALTGVQRLTQTPTTVSGVMLTGVASTVIPVGAQAKTSAGDIFELTSSVTLDVNGNGTGNFQSVEYGAIPCLANALSIIVSGILGWETVTNPNAGVAGSTTQSDQAARAFRQNTLAYNGISLAEAIVSALYNVAGVTSLTFQENVANTIQTINGISMAPHSIFACVKGGTDVAVAAALLENKSSGAAWNGSTTVNVTEPASGQVYAVQFSRPTEIGILVKVTTPNGNAADVKQAILDYAAGLVEITNQDGTSQTLEGFTVGADVSPFDISGAIQAENPGIYIANLQLALAPSGSYSNSPIAIGVDQIAKVTLSNITVVVS